MMIRGTILCIIAVFAILAYAWFGSAPQAAECVTVPDLVRTIQNGGGLVAGIIDVPAKGFDQVVIFALSGTIGMTYIREGCAFFGPLKIGVAEDAAGV